MADLTISSPDNKKAIELSYLGEIRFGPIFFSCKPSGFECPDIETKKVGQDVHWSDDSRFVFLVIFHSVASAMSPDMELIQIDTHTSSIRSIERNSTGKVVGIGFEKGFYKYEIVSKGVVSKKDIAI